MGQALFKSFFKGRFLRLIVAEFFMLYISSAVAQQNLVHEYMIQSGNSDFTTTSDSGLAILFINNNSYFLVKTDSLLNQTACVEIHIPVQASHKQIIQTSDHGYLVSFANSNSGNTNTLLVKTDSVFHVLWSYIYDRNWTLAPVGMLPMDNGDAIIMNDDFSFFRVNSFGTATASGRITNFNYFFHATSFMKLNNYYYVSGYTHNFSPYGIFLARFDSAFQFQSFSFYDTGGDYFVTSMRPGINNNIVLTGYFRTYNPLQFHLPFLLSSDLNQNFQWCKTYSGFESEIYDVYADPSGFYLMCGVSFDSLTSDSREVLIKTLADGTFQAAFGTGNSYAGGFGLESFNELLPGYHNDFYAVSTNLILKSTLQMNPFCYYGPLFYPDSIVFFPTTNNFATTASVNFALTPVVVTETTASLPRYYCNNVNIDEPATNELGKIDYLVEQKIVLCSFMDTLPTCFVSITDVSGRLFYEKKINNCNTIEISVSCLNAGIYFVSVQGGNRFFTKMIAIANN